MNPIPYFFKIDIIILSSNEISHLLYAIPWYFQTIP